MTIRLRPGTPWAERLAVWTQLPCDDCGAAAGERCRDRGNPHRYLFGTRVHRSRARAVQAL